MALNIKNSAVESLVAEVAELAGESKTEAVRRALEDRKTRLAFQFGRHDRRVHIREFLETEVWPSIPADVLGTTLTKEEEAEILGLGDNGV